ncbi:tRNAHis guanylyltransferase [Pyrrhoderma noxium]|uniref:tRNA(His) guanylyltransferase n=1 Tax=Pyrrhoderma noxium TaxID=2282107 RepID=A0A286UA90_9AGAM|nr:tRNAHis guanylyltransferase [Pyrrhoderma noxium]
MAGSKYAYVKSFEQPDSLLPNTFLVCRIDGHAFHRFTSLHEFQKPNDERGLRLMDAAAKAVMEEFPDIVLAFGESDEYSFLLRRSAALYTRRQSKIVTSIVSLFTASYIFLWPKFFSSSPPSLHLDPDKNKEEEGDQFNLSSTTTTLLYPPTFDGRIVCYPTEKEVKDYFRWRQVDTHINNLYNTVFWALVQQGGQTTTEAHATLRGTVSSQKHEILFSRFGINYNTLPARYRKGSILVRETLPEALELQPQLQITTPSETQALEKEDISSQEERKDEQPVQGRSREPTQGDLTTENNDPENDNSNSKENEDSEESRKRARAREKKLEKIRRKKEEKEKARGKGKAGVVVLHEDLIGEEFWERRGEVVFEGGS